VLPARLPGRLPGLRGGVARRNPVVEVLLPLGARPAPGSELCPPRRPWNRLRWPGISRGQGGEALAFLVPAWSLKGLERSVTAAARERVRKPRGSAVCSQLERCHGSAGAVGIPESASVQRCPRKDLQTAIPVTVCVSYTGLQALNPSC